MGTEFTTSQQKLVISDWIENDEAGTNRSVFFVAPCDLTLDRIRLASFGVVTSATYTLQKNGVFSGAWASISAAAEEEIVLESGKIQAPVAGGRVLQKGDGLEFVLAAGTQDYHVVMEFTKGTG